MSQNCTHVSVLLPQLETVILLPQAEVPKDQVKDYSKYVAKKDEMWLGKIEAKAAVGLRTYQVSCFKTSPALLLNQFMEGIYSG